MRTLVGPVLLDFPYVYQLDGNKLYCSAPDSKSELGVCGGVIDYDDGYNFLCCTKCGVRYRAHELQKLIKDELIIEKGSTRRNKNMKVSLIRNGVKVSEEEQKVLKDPVSKIEKKPEPKRTGNQIKVSVTRVGATEEPVEVKADVEQPVVETKEPENDKSTRGIVRLTRGTSDEETPSNSKTATSYVHGETVIKGSSNNETPAFSKEQISGMWFKMTEFDKGSSLMSFRDDNTGVDICIDLSTVDTSIFESLVDVESYKQKISDLNKSLKSVKDRNKESSDKVTELTEQIGDLNVSILNMQKQLKDKDNLIEELRSNPDNNSDRVQDLLKQIEMLNDKVDIDEDDINNLENDLTEKNVEIENLKKSIAIKDETIQANAKELKKLRSEFTAKKNELEKANKTIEKLNKSIEKLNDVEKEMNDHISAEVSERENYEVIISDLEAKIDGLKELNGQYVTQIDELKYRLLDANTPKGYYKNDDDETSATAESANTDDYYEIHYDGLSETGVKLTTIKDVCKSIGIDHDDSTRCLVMTNDEGDYISDQDSNVIIITSIDNCSLNDIQIKF